MKIKLYLDEDVPLAFAHALSIRGVDVITTQKAGNIGFSDAEQLAFATKEQRTVFTHNKRDFILLHNEYISLEKEHSGIIISDQLPISSLLKRVMKLWFSLNASEMRSRIEFLSSWK